MTLNYQHGYDDAKSEPCKKCKGLAKLKELRKIVIDHCTELIEFLESIDGVTVIEATEDSVTRTWTTLEAGDKINALKELRRHCEYER